MASISNNARAGSSRLPNSSPPSLLRRTIASQLGDADTQTPSENSEPATKRARIRRSSKACRSCRIRKRKCSGVPPEPCANCLAAEEECSWTVEDGRSSAVRRTKLQLGKTAEESESTGQAVPHEEPWDPENTDWLSALSGFDGIAPRAPNTIDSAHQSNTFDYASFPNFPSNGLFPGTTQRPLDNPASNLYPHWDRSGTQIPSTDLPAGWPTDVDPFELIMAFSSRMPEVEQTSVQDRISPNSESGLSAGRTGGSGRVSRRSKDGADTFVKVTWWRPHGQTAIAPGLKRMTLKVRVDDEMASERMLRPPADTGVPPMELFSPGGRAPSVPIMKHLCSLFIEFFGSQFPSIDLERCIADLEAGQGSVFLLNCIAATAARFSTHPSIALPELQPHEYGKIFFETAKEMLGSMLAVPMRDTIVALLLLSHVGFANDSEAEEWMFAGMAVRLAIDLGIHLEVGSQQGISAEDRRLNRLVFWSVILLDFALAFGTGRQPTFRVSEISSALPTEEDLPVPIASPRHPFPYACRMMFSYGRLIELLNSREDDMDGSKQREIQKCKMRAVREYAQLPPDIRWDVQNLQLHHQAGRAPIYLQLHLWMHAVIASGHLTGTDYVRRPQPWAKAASDPKTGAMTPNGVAASNAWRNSARSIGDILVLSDIVCPRAYIGLPFCNQAFYVAASCYVKELQQERQAQLQATMEDSIPTGSSLTHETSVEGDHDDNSNVTDLFKSILATVSTENIEKLRKGLSKQTTYWAGVAWVAEALEQQIRGIAVSEIDLASVTEKLASIASIPDAGLLNQLGGNQEDGLETSQVFDLTQWLPAP